MFSDYHSHRRYLVLNMINHFGPVSRTELIGLTDYRPASVSELIKELLDEGLIVETGHSSYSGHGRRRAMLEINHDEICAIGISISTFSITYVVAQFNGEILTRICTEISPDQPKAVLNQQIVAQTRLLLSEYAARKIVGIGICDPLYDPSRYQTSGSLLSSYTHFNDWIHFDLMPMLEPLADIPVNIFSAVTLPALAEQRFGVAKGVQNFICIELSNGIGASICCNGNMVSGAKGVAGELGHTVVDCNSRKLCYCGKPGCVETDTAYPALALEIRTALDKGVFSVLNTYYDRRRALTVQDIRRALDEGDQLCMHCIKRITEKLGIGIANAVNLLNPELIVLFGYMLELGDYFITQLETVIRENTLDLSKDFKIRTSAALESTLPLGAAAELFTSFLRINDYQWIYRLDPAARSDEVTEKDDGQ